MRRVRDKLAVILSFFSSPQKPPLLPLIPSPQLISFLSCRPFIFTAVHYSLLPSPSSISRFLSSDIYRVLLSLFELTKITPVFCLRKKLPSSHMPSPLSSCLPSFTFHLFPYLSFLSLSPVIPLNHTSHFFFFIFHLFPFHLPTLSIIIHLPSFPLFPILHPIPQAPYPALTPSNPLPTFPLLLSFSPSTPASFLPSLPNSFWSGLAPCVVPDGSGRVGLPLSTIAGCIPTVTAAGVGLYRGPVGE